MLHHGAFATKSSQRHAAAYHFAHHGNICIHTQHRLRPAQRHAKARHYLINNQQCPVLGAKLPASLHKCSGGTNKVHIARNRLNNQAGYILAMQGKGFFKMCHIVVLQHQRMLHHLLRHACTGGRTKGCQA